MPAHPSAFRDWHHCDRRQLSASVTPWPGWYPAAAEKSTECYWMSATCHCSAQAPHKTLQRQLLRQVARIAIKRHNRQRMIIHQGLHQCSGRSSPILIALHRQQLPVPSFAAPNASSACTSGDAATCAALGPTDNVHRPPAHPPDAARCIPPHPRPPRIRRASGERDPPSTPGTGSCRVSASAPPQGSEPLTR